MRYFASLVGVLLMITPAAIIDKFGYKECPRK